MTNPALLAALVAVCGSLLALSGRDNRIVVGGLLVAMIAAPLAASPEPSNLTIGFRVIGALLAGYLLWMAARSQSIASEGSGIGIAAEALIAGAAFAVGWNVAPVQPPAGPQAAQAAGFALAAIAVVPLAGRNVMRSGTAAAILVLGISLLLTAWVGQIPALEQMVLMILLVGVVGATSLLSSAQVAAPERERLTSGVEAEVPAVPAETVEAEMPAEAEAGAPTATDDAANPTEPPAKAGPTLRTSRAKSPRAIRKGAAVARVEAEAEGVGESPAPAPTPSKPRVRLIHPREPRQ